MTSRIARPRPVGLLALVLVIVTGANAGGNEGRWVGTWAASPRLTEPANMPPGPGLADSTIRRVVHVSLGGKRQRVRSSDDFGTKSLTLLPAHAGASAGDGPINVDFWDLKSLAFKRLIPYVVAPEGRPIGGTIDE